MNQFTQLTKLQRRLTRQSDCLGLCYPCHVHLIDTEEGFVHLNVESWNTFKLSYRLSDGRFIREGTDLNGPGISVPMMYRRVLRNLRAHAKYIALHNEAKRTNSVVFGEELVAVENVAVEDWIAPIGNEQATFEIFNAEGDVTTWYGFSAEDALRNMAPYMRDFKPVLIRLKSIPQEQGA